MDRNEAIKVVKSHYPANKQMLNEALEFLIPELKEPEDEKIRKWLIAQLKIKISDNATLNNMIYKAIAWLEKQGEQEQLYIRFGEIPTDEKSKIFRGEIEVGTENGVSVYPAFKTIEGDIVLGLNLPITKTTLYTQQHLVEYDDRPCYLVKGDYVGKDTDGQPLIKNVSIIEKIGTYRVKEEEHGEQKPIIEMKSPEESLGVSSKEYNEIVNDFLYSEQKSTDKVEPKFKVGDWVVWDNKIVCNIIKLINEDKKKTLMYDITDTNGMERTYSVNGFDNNARLWDVAKDAKDGDVLKEDSCTFIIERMKPDGTAIIHCCLFDDGDFDLGSTLSFDVDSTYPATKEQRELLFQKMKEAGYEWGAEKKELKKVEQSELTEFEDAVKDMMNAYRDAIGDNDVTTEEVKKHATYMLSLIPHNPAWSEEDEHKLKDIIYFLDTAKSHYASTVELDACIDWLKSLKDRVGCEANCTTTKEWKPSDEQMATLEYYMHTLRATEHKEVLFGLYNDLKKIKG